MDWHAHVTVAAIIKQDGKFLVVEEIVDGETVINNPAGHLEDGESLVEAIKREVLEETGREFDPEDIVGVYLWRHPEVNASILRVAFQGHVGEQDPGRKLDPEIVQTLWLSADELRGREAEHRSPLIMRGVNDFLAGHRYSLALLDYLP